jgi:hypothetical protein
MSKPNTTLSSKRSFSNDIVINISNKRNLSTSNFSIDIDKKNYNTNFSNTTADLVI